MWSWQHDHAALWQARRFAPPEFVPWVEKLLAQGQAVNLVYKGCDFGFGCTGRYAKSAPMPGMRLRVEANVK